MEHEALKEENEEKEAGIGRIKTQRERCCTGQGSEQKGSAGTTARSLPVPYRTLLGEQRQASTQPAPSGPAAQPKGS